MPATRTAQAFATDWTLASPQQLAAAVASTLFALAVLFTPWESFGGVHYADFKVYLATFQPGNASVMEMYRPQTLREFFTQEIVWDEFVRFLVLVVGSPFLALKLISAGVLWVNSYVLYRRYGYLLPTVLLLNPLFLDYALSQLRIAFAITLLLVALGTRRRVIQGLLVLTALFVHSSVPIFIGLFVVVRYVERRGQEWPMHRLAMLIGVVCASLIFMLAFGIDVILLALGDRRAFLYTDGTIGASGVLYAVFWMGMIVMQFLAGPDYLRRPDNLYSVMINVLFVGLTLLDTYGSRFTAAAFPVIIASALNLPAQNRNVLVPAFLVYQIFQLLYWFGIYIFG